MTTEQQTFDFMATCAACVPSPDSDQPIPEAAVAEMPGTEMVAAAPDQQLVLKRLRAQVRCISTAPRSNQHATFSTGSTAIDRLLPGGGLRADTITEWVAEAAGSGAASLSLLAAATHLNSSPSGRGPLVVVSDPEHFYPPAVIALGIPSERIIWVRPKHHADLVWSIDQALRCDSVAAVWACWGAKLDDRDARRFQLAAERGRTPGLFLRPATTRHRPSFAEIRLHVANGTPPQQRDCDHSPSLRGLDLGGLDPGRVLQVTLDRCRGGHLGESVWVQIREQGDIETITRQPGIGNNEKVALHLASELAHPKTLTRRAKRA